MTVEDHGGLGPFNAKDYAELDLDEYRRRFPIETSNLSDAQIWQVVSLAEDDMEDDAWREAFVGAP